MRVNLNSKLDTIDRALVQNCCFESVLSFISQFPLLSEAETYIQLPGFTTPQRSSQRLYRLAWSNLEVRSASCA
jgi:hypothetical protein